MVAIVGVTAGGKTALAEALAIRLDGEVVCADSRQVYRELEIGTGKPTPRERTARPHHLFDALSLSGQETPHGGSAGWYARAAGSVCAEIHARDRTPVLVGGSGLYLEAARKGLSAGPPRAPEVRARLGSELSALGPEALHRRLEACDPVTAARLDARDGQRITRALEVFEASGRPLSWWHARAAEPGVRASWSTIEITIPTPALARRIEQRTRSMFDSGLVEETRGLLEAGHGESLRRLRAVGYEEAMDLIEGRISRAEAEAHTCARTRRLAKRQRTWFRHRVEAVRLDGEAHGLEELAWATLRERRKGV